MDEVTCTARMVGLGHAILRLDLGFISFISLIKILQNPRERGYFNEQVNGNIFKQLEVQIC